MTRRISASVSLGSVAYKHDIRESHRANVDTELSINNVILEDNLKEYDGATTQEKIEAYTNATMQPYIDEYNARQKRADRKINNYIEHYNSQKGNKPKLAYEIVMQMGSHEDIGKEVYENKNIRALLETQYVYEQMLYNFKEKYPHLKVLYATIHNDEPNGTPHLHIAFQPQGEGYKNGLKTRVSVSKALENDGIERIKERGKAELEDGFQLTRCMRNLKREMEQILEQQLRYEIKPEEHGRKRLEVNAYTEAMKKVSQKNKEVDKKILSATEIEEEAHKTLETSLKKKQAIENTLNEKTAYIDEIESQIEQKQGLLNDLKTISLANYKDLYATEQKILKQTPKEYQKIVSQAFQKEREKHLEKEKRVAKEKGLEYYNELR